MRKIARKFAGVLLALFSVSCAATTLGPIQFLNPAGSTSGQAIVSTGSSTAPAWTNVSATSLAAQAANTVVANVTGSSASPTAFPMPSCSTANSALKYTSGTGWACGTTYALTSGTLAQFAATTSAQLAGVISDETGSGSLVFGTGATINAATLAASSNPHVMYTDGTAQSFTSGTAATVITWTQSIDSGSNFTASTGTFSAPHAGYYWVSGQLTFTTTSGTAGNAFKVLVNHNGSTAVTSWAFLASASQSAIPVVYGVLLSLASGDTITIQGLQNSGTAQTLVGGASANFISIVQIP